VLSLELDLPLAPVIRRSPRRYMRAGGLLCVSKYQWSDVFAEEVGDEGEGESTLVRSEIELVFGS
jgi:hypothetical protein